MEMKIIQRIVNTPKGSVFQSIHTTQLYCNFILTFFYFSTLIDQVLRLRLQLIVKLEQRKYENRLKVQNYMIQKKTCQKGVLQKKIVEFVENYVFVTKVLLCKVLLL